MHAQPIYKRRYIYVCSILFSLHILHTCVHSVPSQHHSHDSTVSTHASKIKMFMILPNNWPYSVNLLVYTRNSEFSVGFCI